MSASIVIHLKGNRKQHFAVMHLRVNTNQSNNWCALKFLAGTLPRSRYPTCPGSKRPIYGSLTFKPCKVYYAGCLQTTTTG